MRRQYQVVLEGISLFQMLTHSRIWHSNNLIIPTVKKKTKKATKKTLVA